MTAPVPNKLDAAIDDLINARDRIYACAVNNAIQPEIDAEKAFAQARSRLVALAGRGAAQPAPVAAVSGVHINRNTGRPCGHEYVRLGSGTDPDRWQCALCGADLAALSAQPVPAVAVPKATPEMIAAAWGAWRLRHPTLRMGPGPAFAEAINAALSASSIPAAAGDGTVADREG